jgi:hypothetical protein
MGNDDKMFVMVDDNKGGQKKKLIKPRYYEIKFCRALEFCIKGVETVGVMLFTFKLKLNFVVGVAFDCR